MQSYLKKIHLIAVILKFVTRSFCTCVHGLHDFPGVPDLFSVQLQNVLHKKDQHAYWRSSCFRRWVIWRKLWCWNSLSSMWKPWVLSWSSSSRKFSLYRRTCSLVSLSFHFYFSYLFRLWSGNGTEASLGLALCGLLCFIEVKLAVKRI